MLSETISVPVGGVMVAAYAEGTNVPRSTVISKKKVQRRKALTEMSNENICR